MTAKKQPEEKPQYHLVTGKPGTGLPEVVHIWIEYDKDSSTVTLWSKKTGYEKILEARFLPDGTVIANNLTQPGHSNFRMAK